MIKIKTRLTEIIRQDNHLNNITATASEVHIKFADGIEVSVPVELDIVQSNMINRLKTMSHENLTIDFTDPKYIIKFGPV